MQILAEFNLLEKERMARWSYNQLILKQPHIQVDGLYRNDANYIVKTSDILATTTALDGSNIVDWFSRNKAITCFIHLENEVPPTFSKVNELSISEISKGVGEPLNLMHLDYCLNLVIRKTDAELHLEDIPQERLIRISCSKELNKAQIRQIRKVIYDFEYPAIYQVVLNSYVKKSFRSGPAGIELLPTRLLTKSLCTQLSRLVESDEDFWTQTKPRVYSDAKLKLSDIVPSTWTSRNQLTGFINGSIRKFDNIRNFLTIYDSLTVVLPLADFHDQFFQSIGISEDDFLRLYEIGKIKVIVPQSVSRYRIDFLNQISEFDRKNLLFSRRLAACSLLDNRSRFPFLFPTFGIAERKTLLRDLSTSFLGATDQRVQKWGIALIESLSSNYLDSTYHLDHKGAMGITVTGLTNLFSKTYEAMTGKDAVIEMLSAGNYVEWAAPFNSVIVSPKIEHGYDEAHNVEILANYYSATKVIPMSEIEKQQKIISGILTIDEGVDVIDLAKSFKGSDIARFRSLVTRLGNKYNLEEIESQLSSFNREVNRFEKKNDRLRKLDLSGLISILNGIAGAAVSISAPVAGVSIASLPLLAWVERQLYINRSKNAVLRRVYDQIEKTIHRADSNVVLVSRLKDTING